MLGYRNFRCRGCKRTSNERTGTPYNHLEYPTDVVLLVVRGRLQCKLSLRDLVRMFSERGIRFTHETVRDWEARFAPLLTARLRAKHRGMAGTKWYVDETYVQVAGRCCYLYRAIDRDGNLVDSLLSQTRDLDAAKRCFQRAAQVVGHGPEQVTTDGHPAYPRAIRETWGEQVEHRCNQYLNNRLQQDHRGIKQRYYPLRGFGSFDAAARFCTAHDELRDHFRTRARMGEEVSLAEQRRRYAEQLAELEALLAA
jgi:transposase-like protein